MRKILLFAILLILPLASMGCFTHQHTIGSGQHAGQEIVDHQWYALWGAIPISDEKDGGKIAGTDRCVIITKFTPLDVLINFFTGIGSVYRRTIIIKK